MELDPVRSGEGVDGLPFQDSSGLAPSSSTPLKDSTPTNQGESCVIMIAVMIERVV